MKFFKDDAENLWPLEKVSQISTERVLEGKRQHTIHWAHMESGDALRLFAGEYESIRELSAPIVPCGPGHYILHIDSEPDGKNDPVIRTPILGWSVCPDRGVVPITLDGINDGHDRLLPVLFPNGQVQLAMSGIFDSLDQYLAETSPKDGSK